MIAIQGIQVKKFFEEVPLTGKTVSALLDSEVVTLTEAICGIRESHHHALANIEVRALNLRRSST